MTHASVFSGIGGPEVAAVMLGWENLFHCEINPFGRAVLDYWFPNSKSYEDITTTDFSEWRGRVNVLTGGFPCQPFSYAGQRRGAQDDRYLWPYMFRCIDQVQPDWVVAENVAGILTMVEQGEVSEVASSADLFDSLNDIRGYRLRETFTLQRICDDLESHGYSVQPVLIPACAVGAPHRRDRVFIIGHRRDDISWNTDWSWAELSEKREIPTRSTTESGRVCARGCKETNATLSQDPVCGGQLVGRDGEQGSERNERHAGARGSQRLRGETSRPTPADTDSMGRFRRRCETDRWQQDNMGKELLPESKGQSRCGVPTYTADAGTEGVRREWKNSVHGLGYASNTDNRHTQERGNIGGSMGKENRRQTTGRHGDCGLQDVQGCGYARCGERWKGFPTVSPVHRGNDGLPFRMDDLTIPFGKWRTESLKAYGNAIVPQVMYEIFRAIDQIERN